MDEDDVLTWLKWVHKENVDQIDPQIRSNAAWFGFTKILECADKIKLPWPDDSIIAAVLHDAYSFYYMNTSISMYSWCRARGCPISTRQDFFVAWATSRRGRQFIFNQFSNNDNCYEHAKDRAFHNMSLSYLEEFWGLVEDKIVADRHWESIQKRRVYSLISKWALKRTLGSRTEKQASMI
jgi:hypothetical protein